MQVQKYIVRLLTAVVFSSGLSLTVHAQVGGGNWTSTSVSRVPETSPGCSISGNVFTIVAGSGHAGYRYSSFSSGQRQFQGSVAVNSLGGDQISLKLTGSEIASAKNLIAVKKPGSLYEARTGTTLAAYSIGSTVRINTITNAGTGTVQVYLNGAIKETVSGLIAPFYDRIGAYPTATGTGPGKCTWSSLQFWTK